MIEYCFVKVKKRGAHMFIIDMIIAKLIILQIGRAHV